MSSIALSTWALALLSVVVYAIVQATLSTRRSKSLPPGPPTVPLLGNLLQIPTTKSYLQFFKWSKQYGKIISLKLGSGDLIILNSADAVRDLFDKRGAIYSSRPPNHIGCDLIARDNVHLLLMPYGQEWRNQKKVYQTILNISAVTSLQPIQSAEASLTLKQLADSPQDYYDHIRRYSTAVILSSVYGVRGPEFNHPLVQRLYHAQDQFTAILETGATPPVDIFPILKHLPDVLSPWRKWALSIRAEQRQLYFELLQNVKDRLQRGMRRNCFLDSLLEESYREKNGLDDEHIAYIGGVLMEGGSDTTASTLLAFLMAMLKHPSVLRKAQEEVDRVCGPQRTPRFEDLDRLAYVRNCVSEVFDAGLLPFRANLAKILRWRPVAAGGIPHTLIQDDVYGEYHFRKGTTFLANTWSIHHDPEHYDAPEEFRPERFEHNEIGFKQEYNVPDGMRKTYAFGAGRRICPGQHLAENSLVINISKLVWAFNILPGKSPIGGEQLSREEIDDSIDTAWTSGFLTAPKKFPLELRVRSATHKEVIDREHEEARTTFRKYED